MESRQIYFNEPFLRLGVVSQSLVRVIRFAVTLTLAVAAFIFILSKIPELSWPGIILALLLADAFIHQDAGRYGLTRVPVKGRINVADYLASSSLDALSLSFRKSWVLGGNYDLWLIKALFDFPEVGWAFERLDVEPAEIIQKISDYLNREPKTKQSREEIMRRIEEISLKAFDKSLNEVSNYVMPVDILWVLSATSDAFVKILNLFNITAEDLDEALVFGRVKQTFKRRTGGISITIGGLAGQMTGVRHRTVNRAWTSRPTPTLDMFGTDFTDIARVGQTGLLIGHEQVYSRMVNVLARGSRPNALLLGLPGVGKETIVGHLAYMITKDKVPLALFDKRLVSLDVAALASNADQPELQRRINQIFYEIKMAGNIILYITNIHNLSRTSGERYLSAANTILPLIISNDFPTIGTTAPQEFREYVEKDSAFMDAFEVVRVEEISEEEAVRVLIYQTLISEKNNRTLISLGAIKTAVSLSKKYFREKPLPSSASDLLHEAWACALEAKERRLTSDMVLKIAEQKTNVPVRRAGKEEAAQLLNIETLIHEKLIDQNEAVASVGRSLREYRSGLARKGGPIAAFLFVGPTGVGKTELAKILAKLQFGSEDSMVRVDMSEYQDESSYGRLIGTTGDNLAGMLTDPVRQKPYCLVLLDEFEKAHSDVLNLFLQVFDDGRVTDGLGRVVGFDNTIIIATSNAHSTFIKTLIDEGKTMPMITDELKRKLVDYFKPELLNRFSEIVVFKSLSPQDVEDITKLQLNSFAKFLNESQGITMRFSDQAVKEIARLGFDPAFGARPLREMISRYIKAPLSNKILSEELSRGSNLSVDFDNNEFKFDIIK
jgi:ATP-dependent Clp protease ATP-binding subunit ClpC